MNKCSEKMAFYSNHASAPKFRQTLVLDDYDVFGDGIVQLISAPGHTPWHQLLYLKLEETGPLLLSGDLYHFRLSRVGRRVPVFNVDGPQTLASMTLVIHTNTRSPIW
jgi:N-acyl homoserine lactone hydrolase